MVQADGAGVEREDADVIGAPVHAGDGVQAGVIAGEQGLAEDGAAGGIGLAGGVQGTAVAVGVERALFIKRGVALGGEGGTIPVQDFLDLRCFDVFAVGGCYYPAPVDPDFVRDGIVGEGPAKRGIGGGAGKAVVVGL